MMIFTPASVLFALTLVAGPVPETTAQAAPDVAFLVAPNAPAAPVPPASPVAPVAPLPPLALEAPAAPAAPPAQPGSTTPAERDPVYADGMKAMDEGRWADAVTAFGKVVATHGDRAEAALYWKAYSLEKLGRKDDARAACDQLRTSKPSSNWNRECVMLRLQNGPELGKLKILTGNPGVVTVDGDEIDRTITRAWERANDAMADSQYIFTYNDGHQTGPHDPNDDLKLIALNSLMQQEPAKAVPALRTFIFSNKPIELRRHALFMLTRSKAPEAQALLTEVANNKSDPSLQRVAVQTLAVGRGKQASPELLSIYRNSTDKGVKRAVISGLFTAHDAQDLVELARNEKDIDTKREIVSQLALMHDPAATAYMEELLK